MIKEVIVVEGKDDISAVKKAVDAEVLAVHGYGINEDSMNKIREAAKRTGVIILTDPDHAGERIRRMIAKRVPDAKHAYIMRDEGTKNGNVGVENADAAAIIRALENAKAVVEDKAVLFSTRDMVFFKLSGAKDSKKRRQILGKALGIGYGNTSSFLSRLNAYKVSKEEFEKAIVSNFEEYRYE
ncbi:ribonuclease M5 [Proteiniclasticum sp. SCR006]|uniref:Ribonuclease M5 n=1 Tax=Proteiniclasticum aestuarii TaxID=2817862 RepID=A0A939HCC0_9CLOT|nr:ribonuclease M5 [Proteiniclasticum aestuarii]MBO1264980.1 ribonuclease M5 [Proteiniclasticum aestuarii]